MGSIKLSRHPSGVLASPTIVGIFKGGRGERGIMNDSLLVKNMPSMADVARARARKGNVGGGQNRRNPAGRWGLGFKV